MKQDHHSIWQSCLQQIAPKVPSQGFKTWFLPIKATKYADDVLTIQVPNTFFYEWLEEHYLDLLTKAIKNAIGPKGKLAYAVRVNKPSSLHAAPTTPLANSKKVPEFITNPILVNNEYTFANFIAGTSNEVPKSAAETIADKPGKTSFNPCLFYGPTGTGKTHLAQSILQAISPLHFEACYLSTEDFTTQFVTSLRKNLVQEFINYYLRFDVLIIDDVQFFAGKDKTQEVFFYLFKHYHQQHKQLVMTSDRSPKDLQGLQQRLLSRFKWGLSIDLQLPDYETRLAILQRKLDTTHHTISRDLQSYIANHVATNVRELEGVINSIIGYITLTGKEPDPSLIKKIIENVVCRLQTEGVDISFILRTVAEYFHLQPNDLRGPSRKKETAQARHVAMYMIKKYDPGRSLKSIGGYFSGRDHSSVIYALQAVDNLLATDKRFKTSLEEIRQRIARATLPV